MIAVDTSIVVAAFASWHEGHGAAARILERRPHLPAHVAIEAVSVLTRLPPPHRARTELVREFLDTRFPLPYLILSAAGTSSLLDRIVTCQILGGAVYDALIAVTVEEAGAILVSRDRRASSTYDAIGIEYQLAE